MTGESSGPAHVRALFTFEPRWTAVLIGAILVTMANAGVVQGANLRERVISNHQQFIPAGEGPFPTIVAIPGCSGVALPDADAENGHPDLREDDRLFRRHYLRMSESLRAEGFAVILVHVQGGEGLLTACRGEIPGERIAEYIDEAVAWARTLDFVDRERIHVVGWSMGGGGALAWLHGPRSEMESVRSVVSVYPGCSRLAPLTSRVPLLLLLGHADDIALPSHCEDLLEISGLGETVEVRRYEGARHGWDIEDAPGVLEIGNDMTIGYQREAAEASWREILKFLAGQQD